MKALNILIRRFIICVGFFYFFIKYIPYVWELPFWVNIFYFLMFFIFWWLLVSYMNYFIYKDGKGFTIKFLYFRKFNIENIVKATYLIDGQDKHEFIFGSLYTIILRQENMRKIIISFVSKTKYEKFISIIEGNTKLKVVSENDTTRKVSEKKSDKFSKYVKSSNAEDIFHSLLRAAESGRLTSDLNSRLPIKIIKSKFQIINKKPLVHCEGVYRGIWFQYSFHNNGLLLTFDLGELDGKYMTDDYLSWDNFKSKKEVYDFVIEAFSFYYNEVNNNIIR